ncbi:respiratory nitrate reductase subunit gamma [Streptomyces buecherae]|uniref:Nitrate reductase-like protein NarX n=1 Tax=Streptomyces buecherae TaxID=2763006 RepID=A0A7H8N2M3_9ACTN|nr:respiratory nitrate reductase subunit gamma [Streptomyces buecherae]QKW48639.1 respiratory nitrate reductase subunit gamma [Streptomyces buecherae]
MSASPAPVATVDGVDLVLWVTVPYICLAVFAVGHVWRYQKDQFGWTSHTSQLLEHRWLRWGSPLFHLGALAVIAGHAVGLVVPAAWTRAVGISEHDYHLFATVLGSVAGAAMITGLGLLCARRLLAPRVRATTSRSDRWLFPLLSATVALGMVATVTHNVVGGGYDYRSTVSPWFRGLFSLSPRPEAMADAPLLFQLHALTACLLFAAWPFTRLVHVWSAPVGYLRRPYLVYRYRSAAGPRSDPRGRGATHSRRATARAHR